MSERIQSKWINAGLVILLLLFGALEADSVLHSAVVDGSLAGLGMVGSVILLWLRR